MTVHDLSAAREKRKLCQQMNQHAQADRAPAYKPNEDQAILTALTSAHYEDTQLYAAVRDFGPHPETVETVPGFHILKFAPKIGSDALPYETPVKHLFYPQADFAERFAGTGGIVEQSLAWMFEKYSAPMKDPHGYAEICRRKIAKLERVSRDGLYNRNIDSLRFDVKAGDYVLTPVKGAPEVISDEEAHNRLSCINKKGAWSPIPL
jgi:hypothetical protein